MERTDVDEDERIRHLITRPDQQSIDRVLQRAFASAARRHRPSALWVVAPALVSAVTLGVWVSRQHSARTPSATAGAPVTPIAAASGPFVLRPGDVTSLRGPDGTTVIVSLPPAESGGPPGTGVVVSMGVVQ
jgi:hypothetical protein